MRNYYYVNCETAKDAVAKIVTFFPACSEGKNVPISVISEGMGHDSEMTTQIYLASFDTAVVDEANSVILNSL